MKQSQIFSLIILWIVPICTGLSPAQGMSLLTPIQTGSFLVIGGLGGGGGGIEACYPVPGSELEIPSCIDPNAAPDVLGGIKTGELTPLGTPWCSKVTIKCGDQPHYDPRSCELTTFCPAHSKNLEGLVLPADGVAPFFRRLMDTASSAAECGEYTVGVHEGIHAKDWADDPLMRPCQSEINAYQASIKALNVCLDKFNCRGLDGSIFGSTECKYLYRNQDLQERAMKWNTCVCERAAYPITYQLGEDTFDLWGLLSAQESGACFSPYELLKVFNSNSGCSKCYNRCVQDYGSRETCQMLLLMYCKDFTPRESCTP